MAQESKKNKTEKPILQSNKLEDIALQLRCPTGNDGIAIGELLDKSNSGMIKQSMKALHLVDKNRVLELGHGSCRHLPDLLKKAIDLKYFGMEISKVMKENAERINQKSINKRQALFQLYNGIDIPYVSNFFDKILTVNTLYFIESPLKFLKEMDRVLKPGGTFVLTFVNGGFMKDLPFVKDTEVFNLFYKNDIEKLVKKTPFILSEIIGKKEKVLSKTKETVHREYFIVVLNKKEKVKLV